MSPRSLRVVPVPGPGAEDVVVDPDGTVWTGTADGHVFKIRGDGGRVDRIGSTGGRPLGLELLGDDRLLIADAHRGLLVMDKTDGAVTELVCEVEGRPMRFCNNAAVAASGEVYFSDSSTRHGIEDWRSDLIEHTRTGRLMVRRESGEGEVLLDSLAFANGVALAADGSWVAVAETGARTVVRLWLTGPRRGQRELMLEDLPGYPDNIARGSDGLLWIALASPVNSTLEASQRAPAVVRRLATRVPDRLQPQPQRTARAQAYDDQGALVHDIEADAESFHMVTGVREHEGRLWLGSLAEPAVATLEIEPGHDV